MEVNGYENNTTCNMVGFEESMDLISKSSKAWSILYKGVIVAIVGYVDLWESVCELFLLPSVHMKKHPIIVRTLLKMLKSGIFNNHRRVQVRGLADTKHLRLFKFLGFEKEGTLRKYDSLGNDYEIWARVKE